MTSTTNGKVQAIFLAIVPLISMTVQVLHTIPLFQDQMINWLKSIMAIQPHPQFLGSPRSSRCCLEALLI